MTTKWISDSAEVKKMTVMCSVSYSRKVAYGRLIKMKDEFIKKSGVIDIKFTPVDEDDDLYKVGPIGDIENVRTVLDLIKD